MEFITQRLLQFRHMFQYTPFRHKGIIHELVLLSLGENKIDPHFLNECKHLKMISQFAVGYDNINIPEATRLGIPVGNTPEVLSDATADIAFGLMIAVSRKFFFNYKKIFLYSSNI